MKITRIVVTWNKVTVTYIGGNTETLTGVTRKDINDMVKNNGLTLTYTSRISAIYE